MNSYIFRALCAVVLCALLEASLSTGAALRNTEAPNPASAREIIDGMALSPTEYKRIMSVLRLHVVRRRGSSDFDRYTDDGVEFLGKKRSDDSLQKRMDASEFLG